MKIVQFENGKYAIRGGNFLTGYEYLDLNHLQYWWSKKYKIKYYNDITSTDLEYVKNIFIMINDKGKKVNEKCNYCRLFNK